MQAYGICVCRILTLGTWGKKCTSMWLTQRTTVALFPITQFSVVHSQAYKSELPVTSFYKVCTTSTIFTYSYLFLCNSWCLFFSSCREQSHRFVYSEASPVALWRNTVSLLFLLASFTIWLQWSNPHLQFVYCGYETPGKLLVLGESQSGWCQFDDSFLEFDGWFGSECNSQKWERCRVGVIIFFPGQVQVNDALGVGGWVNCSVCNLTG
jgi:hypothetical protein